MMWPDCSPPSERSRAIISSITYLSPTGHRTSSMPRSRSAISRPMLLITVATMALPRSRPVGLQVPGAHQHHRVAVDDAAAVIDEDRAVAVAVERDAEPAAVARDHAARAGSGCVDPQPRLMLRPSGAQPSAVTSKPRSRNRRGASRSRRAVGAVDRDARAGPGAAASGSACRAWARYASDQIARRDIGAARGRGTCHDGSP